MSIALRDFAAEMFQPMVGRKLVFLRPAPSPDMRGARVEMDLIEVRVPPGRGPSDMRRPFSLLLTLRDEPPLDDHQLHRFVAPGFEECELLLSRISVPELDRRDGTMYYEVAFG